MRRLTTVTSRDGSDARAGSRLLVALAVVAALGLAGCGTGSDETPDVATLADDAPSAAAEETAQPTAAEAEELFARCMEEAGFDASDWEPLEDDQGAAIGEDDPIPEELASAPIQTEEEAEAEFEAFDACNRQAAVETFDLDADEQAQLDDFELAMARCMRDEGLDVPDPGTEGSSLLELSEEDGERFEDTYIQCGEELEDQFDVLDKITISEEPQQ